MTLKLEVGKSYIIEGSTKPRKLVYISDEPADKAKYLAVYSLNNTICSSWLYELDFIKEYKPPIKRYLCGFSVFTNYIAAQQHSAPLYLSIFEITYESDDPKGSCKIRLIEPDQTSGS